MYKLPIPAFFPPPANHIAAYDETPSVTTPEPTQQISLTPSLAPTSTETTEIVLPSPSSSAPLRTSSRVSKKPGWLQDYVTMTAVKSLFQMI